jgi:uncharacterized membrane protein YkvI
MEPLPQRGQRSPNIETSLTKFFPPKLFLATFVTLYLCVILIYKGFPQLTNELFPVMDVRLAAIALRMAKETEHIAARMGKFSTG